MGRAQGLQNRVADAFTGVVGNKRGLPKAKYKSRKRINSSDNGWLWDQESTKDLMKVAAWMLQSRSQMPEVLSEQVASELYPDLNPSDYGVFNKLKVLVNLGICTEVPGTSYPNILFTVKPTSEWPEKAREAFMERSN